MKTLPRTLKHISGGEILSCTTGYQFLGEEYCLARPDMRRPNSTHVETVVLLSGKKVDGHICIDLNVDRNSE